MNKFARLRSIPLALVFLGAGPFLLAHVDAAESESTDTQLLLDAITPSFTVPPVDLFDVEEYGSLPARLLGVDLLQDGKELSGDSPWVDATQPLVLRAYWEPIRRLESQARFRATVWDSMCLIKNDFDLRFGPLPADAPWEAAEVAIQEYPIDLLEAATSFSGRGYLNLTLLTPRSATRKERPLLLIPISLGPLARESLVTERVVKEKLGENAAFIPTMSRLGIGASLPIAIPSGLTPSKSVHVLSSMAYRNPPQGVDVCEIQFTDRAGKSALGHLRSGENTARADYDALTPERDHDKVTVLRSRDSGQLDALGRPVRTHIYMEPIPIPPELGPLASIEIRCVAETFFDLFGLAFAE